jgi:hypothetical protein
MDVRPRTASGRSDTPDVRTFADLRADAHCNRGKMTVACMNAIAMVDFDHVAVATTVAGENNGSRRGGMHDATPRAGKVDSGMKGVAARKGIDARSKAAAFIEAGGVHRHGKRHMVHCCGQSIQLI